MKKVLLAVSAAAVLGLVFFISGCSASHNGSSKDAVVLSDASVGDIVVFGYGSHVGIYAGDGKMVHCATPESGTVYAYVYEMPSACVRVVW